jgi:hypothetical protein
LFSCGSVFAFAAAVLAAGNFSELFKSIEEYEKTLQV